MWKRPERDKSHLGDRWKLAWEITQVVANTTPLLIDLIQWIREGGLERLV